ncbi:MAG: formate/nitrite transporter family protein [Senegalimassilia sp.]|uniref:formate/nitrite transporter family protein n=1 Tax=Senegalimassilia TaxID=1473205 RepID=UPI0023F1AB9D|nr:MULTISPECIES: formate/nitrite transporter family protein [Senegalimassilia]MDR3885826.1 formate/nitrite transporter family protein [Senegalimassilia sp.]MDR4054007.1 formate/nitrite transporter family protein [Senegalimassilia sp.]
MGQLLTLFAKGIMCNIFVCLAVLIGFARRTVTGKVIGIILPISPSCRQWPLRIE